MRYPLQPSVDIMIKNGLILTMNESSEVIQQGTLLIRGSKIVQIGDASLAEQATAEKVIDACGNVVMPGMINGHTHIPMILFRGLGNDRTDIIRNVMFPLEKEFTTKQMCHDGALLACVEMLRGGVTCFADMYYFEDEVARATKSIGLRAILGETIMKYPTPDAPEPYGGIENAKAFITRWKDDSLITPAFAPHAPYTVDPEKFTEIQRLADELNVPILTHLSEVRDEIPNISSTVHLNNIGVLSERLIAAHCIHVEQEDLELLKKHRVGVVLNVLGNAKGGVFEVAPAIKMLNMNIDVCLGSDGPMSANTQDIFSQLRFVSAMNKHFHGNRSVMSAYDVVKMATIGGAKSLKMDAKIGSLEIGKCADIIIVSNQQPHQYPSYNPYQTLVHATFPTDVITTIVDGKILMERHQLMTIDESAIRLANHSIVENISKMKI